MDRNTAQMISDVNKQISDLEHDLAEGSNNGDLQSSDTPKSSNISSNPLNSLFSKDSSATEAPDDYNDDGTNTKVYTNPFTGKRFLQHDSEDETPPKKSKDSSLLDDFSTSVKNKHSTKSSKNKTDRSIHSLCPSGSDGDSDTEQVDPQMQQLLQEYQSSKPKYLEDPTTDPIPDPLANTLETWFWSIYSKDEVKAELGKTSRPLNADALIPTRINEAVFRALAPAGLSRDLPCRFIQNAFMKASQPFAKVWSTLIALENHLKASQASLSVKMSSSLTVDFQVLRKQMDLGLRLLGIANSQMVTHRKETLSAYLNKDFKKICKSHIPFDQWMFGSNLKALLEDTIRVNRMVQQQKPSSSSTSSRKPFFQKRGGRGGPHRTYQQNQGFQQQRGRGFGRGWQTQNNTQQLQNQIKSGNQQKGQMTKN